jgi:glutamyl-tRNA reductase
LIGAGKMSELSARYLKKNGATDLRVVNRTLENAQRLAKQLGGRAYPFEQRWQHLVEADIVIGSTSCPHPIFSRDEAEVIRRERDGRQLLLIDIAVPRDIDPAVRDVHGIFLYDIDDLENVVKRNAGDRATAANAAQEIINQEAKFFRRKLMAERVVPTIVALRSRLDEICHQELESFRLEAGPFTAEQEKALDSLTTRITQRISNQLPRELKETRRKDRARSTGGCDSEAVPSGRA